MKLDDGKPWFRRWMGIGRWPITFEGKLLVLFTLVVCVAAAFMAFQLPPTSPWHDALLGFAFLVAIGFNVVAFWKTEDSF